MDADRRQWYDIGGQGAPVDDATTRVSVRIPAGILAKIDAQSRRDARSRSNMIAVLLREAIDARAERGRP